MALFKKRKPLNKIGKSFIAIEIFYIICMIVLVIIPTGINQDIKERAVTILSIMSLIAIGTYAVSDKSDEKIERGSLIIFTLTALLLIYNEGV